MEILRCKFGHFYDGEQYISCPICDKLEVPKGEVVDYLDAIPGLPPPHDDPLLPGIPLPKDDDPWGSEERTVELPKGAEIRLAGISCPSISCVFTLANGQEATLGRSIRADYILNAQDNAVSGLHFCLMWNTDCLLLKDLNSTNGTICDGVKFTRQQYAPVMSGATLRVGRNTYRITYTEIR